MQEERSSGYAAEAGREGARCDTTLVDRLVRARSRAAGWLGWLLPGECLLCDAPLRPAHGARRGPGGAGGPPALCRPCLGSLPRPRLGCAVCAEPMSWGGWCPRCLVRRPHFETALAALRYEPPVDYLIGRFKYRGDRVAGRALGSLLSEAAATSLDARKRGPGPQVLVPMPLHPARLRTRGFNQAGVLAELAGRALGLDVNPIACARIVDTAPQAGLAGRAARVRNVGSAFRADGSTRGCAVAIVDDVMTTGASVNALARELLGAGTARVEVWVCARAGHAEA